jgi:hypothetical protein
MMMIVVDDEDEELLEVAGESPDVDPLPVLETDRRRSGYFDSKAASTRDAS